jgi:putative nucleotidyltransferase with HDIG domain
MSNSRTSPLILVLLVLRAQSPSVSSQALVAVVILAALALVAEFLAFLLPRGARGSISFIPALAAVLVAPYWVTVAAIALVKVLVESSRKIEFEKAVFNVAQYALSAGLAVLVFKQAAGVSFLELPEHTLSAMTEENGVAALAAFLVSFLANHLLVSFAIALESGSQISSIWRANHFATVGIDLLVGPLIFVFAWVYVRFGPMAAATLWVPIVGIRQVHKTNLELERNNEELLELMVKSIEARDPYTSGHSRRVQDFSVQIARALGLSEKEVELTSRAALLHDVGKIHEKYGPIPVKADRLTLEEWKTMREHPDDGARLIATMSPLRELVELVRHHHENWDGTGYPSGLAGELIPLPARIIRFADTIDAMTTERPYRPMMSETEVRAELVRCRGTQFDPTIVDRLLSSPVWKTMFSSAESEAARRYGQLGVIGAGKPLAGVRRA